MTQFPKKDINKYFLLFLMLGIAANIPALFSDIMDQDSAFYATIAKNIVLRNDWVNLIGNGADWLDKPHLPFWITALSCKVFGITAFAYKLPSFLCWLLGVYYTYKLAESFYDKATAQMATIIFVSSLHVILANYDLRAEGYVTTFIVAAVFHLYQLYKNNSWKQVFIAAFFCALAVMTKGIFVLITIASGFVLHWIFTKQWKQFANMKWYAMIALTLLFILPELYCLYVQFDLHPEKIVYGAQHVSGIRFFFWDSQFGRFFNTGPIKGKGDPSFFFHTTAWAFLPWTIVLLASVFVLLKNIRKNLQSEKVIITGSVWITFFIFSISQFQLPHYIVILFPHFSILSASWLLNNKDEKTMQKLNISAGIIFILLASIILLLCYYFRFENMFWMIACIAILAAAFIFLKPKDSTISFISKNLIIALLISSFIKIFFYGELMKYEGGMVAAKWQNENKPVSTTIMLDCNNWPFEFYTKSNMIRKNVLRVDDFSQRDSITLFGPLASIQKIDGNKIETTILRQVDYFRITKLNAKFINYKTRPLQTEQYAIALCTLKP